MQLTLAITLASHLLAVLALPSETRAIKRVIYIQDNDPSGNSIVTAEISSRDGTLSPGVRTSTGGKGLALLVAASQDLVKVSGNYLFTANAGDATLSMFIINPFDPLRPYLVGKPVSTLGQNPASVTYSPKLNIACVANGGIGTGNASTITCFTVDPMRGLTVSSQFPAMFLPTGPAFVPFLPTTLIRDIVFNPSSSALFVASFHSLTAPGYIYAYPVVHGQVSQTPVINAYPESILPFSLNFLGSDSRMFATNVLIPKSGVATLNASSLNIKSTHVNVFSDFNASVPCWAAYAPAYDTVFVADFGVPNITAINATDGTTIDATVFSTPSFGGLDNVVNGDYLYQLTAPFTSNFSTIVASPQVLVYDITPLKMGKELRLVQSFDIFEAYGIGYEFQGMALWPHIPSEH